MAFSGNKKTGPISDINITPLVDVMFVLLVIFMITAPLMLNGIKLQLPKTKEVNKINLNASQIILSMTGSNEFFIGTNRVLLNEILPEITTMQKKNRSDVVYLRADYKIPYGEVARIISFLKRGGINNIALVTETEDVKK